MPQLKVFTDSVGNLADKLQNMSTDELMNLGKTVAVLAGAAPAFSALGKSAGTCGDILSGLGEISGGTVAKLNKMPGDIKKLGGKMKAGAKALSTAKDAVLIPFEGMEEQISGVLGKITYHVKYYGAGIQNQISKLGAPVTNAVSKFTAPIRKLGSVIGGSFGKVGTQISGYASIIGNAFAPILSSVAGFIPSFISLLNFGAVAAVVVAGLGLIYSQFGTQIDQLLLLAQTKGPEIISNLGNGITAALPGLMGQGATLILGLMNAITANLPALISTGASIIATLVSSLAEQLPQLIPAAASMILTLVEAMISNLPQIISSGLDLMMGLAQGIANAIPQVTAKAPVIIGKLASTIITNLPKIIQTGIQILTQLAVGLVKGIPTLLGKIPSMISQIKNAFTSVDWGSVGVNIIKGIASGLSSAAKSLADAAANAASNALDWVKSKLGIHSPSRVFRDQVGKMMALGMGIGFEKNIPVKSMSAGVKRAVGSLKKSAELITSRSTSNNSVDGIRNHPVWGGPTDQTDYDRLERIQMKAAKTIAKRPIYLGTERIDKPLPKGAVPQV